MVTVVINIMEGGRRKEKFVYDQSSLHSYLILDWGKEVANGRSMAIGMFANVWVSCEVIAAGGWKTVSLLTKEEEGESTGVGATSTTGSLGFF